MKNRFTLIEVGSSLIIFGLSMILFPNIFHSSSTHQSNDNHSLMIEGSVLLFVGILLLVIKLFNKKHL